MQYIQRLSSCSVNHFEGTKSFGFSRFMDPDYMGSSEFEWGTYGFALASICQNQMVLRQFRITENNKTVTFWAVCAEDDYQRLLDKMPNLANGTAHTKERTEIDNHFRGEVRRSTADGWLVVDRHIHGRDVENPAIFFTKSRYLAAKFYCEYKRRQILGAIDKVFEVKIFDQVMVPGYNYPAKVSAILENGAYVVKFPNKKTLRCAAADLWPVSLFPSSDLHAAGLLN